MLTGAVSTGAVVTGAVATGGAWRHLLSLALPVSCPGCGQPDVAWCPGCAQQLLSGPCVEPPVPLAAVPGALGVPRVPARSAALYTGGTRELVVAWKEHGRHDLTPLLAAALARAVLDALAVPAPPVPAPAPPTPALLVAVPSTRSARRRRGGAPVHDLAARTARHLRRAGHPARAAPATALRLVRSPRDQAGLGAAARAANLAGAHRAGAGLRGRPCVVVDDVTTTGATLAEAVRAVLRAGGTVTAVATVAATPRRRGTERWPGVPPVDPFPERH